MRHEQWVEAIARAEYDRIFSEWQIGRRSSIVFADYHPDVERRLRQMLAGETQPRYESPDD